MASYGRLGWLIGASVVAVMSLLFLVGQAEVAILADPKSEIPPESSDPASRMDPTDPPHDGKERRPREAPPRAASSSTTGSSSMAFLPPPAGQPIMQSYAQLVRQAEAGDARSACRLASALGRCSRLPALRRASDLQGQSLGATMDDASADETRRDQALTHAALLEDQREDLDRLCDGVEAKVVAEAFRWQLRAAELGHIPSMVSFVTAPALAPVPEFDDLDQLHTYRSLAPQYAQRALMAGNRDIVIELARAYLPNEGSYLGRVTAESPELAFTYHLLAARLFPTAPFADPEQVNRVRAGLTRADELVAEQRASELLVTYFSSEQPTTAESEDPCER